MTAIDTSAPRTLPTTSRIAAGSLRSAGNAPALMPLPSSAFTPAESLSRLRATSATDSPALPNFSATAAEMPGPYPATTMVDMGASYRPEVPLTTGAGAAAQLLDLALSREARGQAARPGLGAH